MKIYHGSDVIVEEPKILENQRMLDFGKGFYTTSNEIQATRWAQKVSVRRKSNVSYITIYDFDELKAIQKLKVIRFDKPDKEWLEFVCTCRSGKENDNDYDIVFGPVADDNVYATVQLYELGVLRLEETLERLKVEELYNQILFHTEKALEFCKYNCAYEIGVEGNE